LLNRTAALRDRTLSGMGANGSFITGWSDMS
jgi:hypothetical protein